MHRARRRAWSCYKTRTMTMTPYNECENRWLSSAGKQIKKHIREYEPLYVVLVLTFATLTMVLMVLTAVKSFL